MTSFFTIDKKTWILVYFYGMLRDLELSEKQFYISEFRAIVVAIENKDKSNVNNDWKPIDL